MTVTATVILINLLVIYFGCTRVTTYKQYYYWFAFYLVVVIVSGVILKDHDVGITNLFLTFINKT